MSDSYGGGGHHAVVSAWFARARDLSDDALVDSAEAVLHDLWARAVGALGDVTVGAVLRRVVVHSVERHPLLRPVTVGAIGPRLSGLRSPSPPAAEGATAEALAALLVETLFVLGYMTADVLTPALHDVLARPDVAAGPAAAQ